MTRGRVLLIFAAVVLTRLVVAALTPIVQDEAYYLEWTKALDWGYFDHPPLIAWVNLPSLLAPGSAFAGRLGTMLAAALAFPFVVGLLGRCGITEGRAFVAGLLLAQLNAFVLLAGVLTTPDAVLLAAWCAALHEAAVAVTGDRRRWLTAGLATGLGLLGKYSMVLIGPVFLWALVRGDRKALRTPWPYAGGLVALLVFAPHLMWNAGNEWVSLRMQMQHGLEGGHDPGFAAVNDLPWPAIPQPGDPELELGRAFVITKPPPEPSLKLPAFLRYPPEYAGGQLAVWGVMLVTLVHAAFAGRRRSTGPPIDRALRPLLGASVWVPLGFFLLVSLRSHVEANWAAMYTIGAAVLLAGFGASHLRQVVVCAAGNLLLCLGLAAYASSPSAPAGQANRVLKEVYGWPELAAYVTALDGPVLTREEQLTSMLRFHSPGLRVAQWPGVDHPSEYTRRAQWAYYRRADLEQHGFFWFVSDRPQLPVLDGFEPHRLTEIRPCPGQGVVITKGPNPPPEWPACDDPSNVWYVARYRARAPVPDSGE